jgi:hypothetical protein
VLVSVVRRWYAFSIFFLLVSLFSDTSLLLHTRRTKKRIMTVLNSRSKSPVLVKDRKKVHRRSRWLRSLRSRFSALPGYLKLPRCVYLDGQAFLSSRFDEDYRNNDEESSCSDVNITDDEEYLALLEEESSVCVIPDQRIVHFSAEDSVAEIPSYRDFSEEEKVKIWTSTRVIGENARRNKVEWRWERKKVDRVLEEDNFVIDCNANLVHPAHIKKPTEVVGEWRASC